MVNYKLIEIDGETYATIDEDETRRLRSLKYDLFLRHSGIPDFYHNIEFSDYQGNHESKEIKRIKYYAENCYKDEFKHVSLFLWGSHSTQKTALVCNILKESLRNGMKAKFILAGTLINKLMKLQGYGTDDDIVQEIKDLKECDIICIDDVGDIEKSLQWKNNSLVTAEWDNFFRDILGSATRVIMTSNFAIESFQQFFSESLYQLIDRNTIKIHLTESVKEVRQYNLESIFNGMGK